MRGLLGQGPDLAPPAGPAARPFARKTTFRACALSLRACVPSRLRAFAPARLRRPVRSAPVTPGQRPDARAAPLAEAAREGARQSLVGASPDPDGAGAPAASDASRSAKTCLAMRKAVLAAGTPA